MFFTENGKPSVSVTVVPTNSDEPQNYDGSAVNVDYKTGNLDSLAALVQSSAFCVMPVKVNCQNTMVREAVAQLVEGWDFG